jgi:PIN domain nuclease of toxin-antitoxin system
MKLLLDTHAFLWFVLNDRQLSAIASNLIAHPANDVLISAASYWEIAIKISLGKYHLPGSFEAWMQHQIQVNEFEILPITISHAALLSTLPFHHKDPFDRLLIAQALVENLSIISMDKVLDMYSVVRRW